MILLLTLVLILAAAPIIMLGCIGLLCLMIGHSKGGYG